MNINVKFIIEFIIEFQLINKSFYLSSHFYAIFIPVQETTTTNPLDLFLFFPFFFFIFFLFFLPYLSRGVPYMTHCVLESGKTFACCRLRKGISCGGIGMTERSGGAETRGRGRRGRRRRRQGT